mgnify:FL=1
MTSTTVERSKILKMLAVDYSAGNWECLIDKVELLVGESFSAGYSFAKKESVLVEKAAESLSE